MVKEVDKNDLLIINKFLMSVKETKINLQDMNNPFLKMIAYIKNNKIVGFLNYSLIYDHCEINNIIVDKKYRKQGIGTCLIDYLLNVSKDCINITLEVREDNEPAISLYKKYGFKEVAIRDKYYHDVNGILMVLELGD